MTGCHPSGPMPVSRRPDVASVTSSSTFEPGDRLDVVLPVHNEAASIEATLDEWFVLGASTGADITVVVCEDGSTDGTRALLERLAVDRPVVLVTGAERKGYSQAVVDGLRRTTAPWVCTADGDGQCDPAGLVALLAESAADTVVVGVRRPRRDPVARRAMSRAMNVAFVALHRIRLDDASSPFCVIPGTVARAVAAVDPELPQGYWWEFHVRRSHLGVGVVEVPVNHRARPAGTTRVYLPRHLPTIAAVHLRGLWRLRRR